MLAEAGGNLVINVFVNLLLLIKNCPSFLIENQCKIDKYVGTVGIHVKNSVPSIISNIS